jgi:hypothetical protein
MVLVASVAAVVVARHLRGEALGRRVPGGILIADAVVYDVLTGLALGPFYAGVADHVARSHRRAPRYSRSGAARAISRSGWLDTASR